MTRSSVTAVLRGETARLLRGSGFIFGCRLTGAGLTFLSQVLLARTMGASELGIYALTFSWCLLLANLSTMGFIPAAMRFIGKSLADRSTGYARGFMTFAGRTTLLTSLLITSCVCLVSQYWLPDTSPLQTPLLVAACMIPMLAGLHLIGGFGNAYANFSLGFLPTSVFRPGLFCAFIVTAWAVGIQLDSTAAVLLSVAAVAIVCLPTFILGARFLSRKVKGAPGVQGSGWFRTSASLLIAALFTGYFPEVIIIVAGTVLPSDELAILHVSLRLSMLLSFGLLAVDTFTGPEIARHYAEGDLQALQRTVSRATRIRFWASLAATVTFAVGGIPMLSIFGDEFVAGYPVLLVLVLGQMVQGSVGPVVRLMSVSVHQNRAVFVFVLALLASIVLTLVLTPVFGAMGAAIAASSVTALWGIRMRQLVVKLVGVTPRISG